MDYLIRYLPLLLVASTLAQYEGYDGFEGYHHKVNDHHHQSLDDHHGEEYEVDYHAHPKYSFDYSVKDPHTGDDKEHWETRDGDKVKGSYTLIETDGTKRVVEYEADDKNGFNAVVHRIGTPKHDEPTFHHKEPEYHHKEPEYHHKEPEYHHKEPEYHHKEQEYHHKEPEYHHKEPEYHHKEQEYHHKEQEYQHKEPEYHVKEPYYAKPSHEPVAYGHDYGFDEGFVPSFGH